MIKQVFCAAGIPIREGYGLTETSPGLAIGRFTKGGAILDAIGPALSTVDLLIDESDGNYRPGEGEILAKGPNIMMGYFNKPEATAAVTKVINDVKWFCTGDVGTFVEGPDGTQFLKITDRKKELLKTSGGKYVAPAPIENKLKENFLVEQVMVVGEKKKFVSALIVPAAEALQDWCKHNGVSWTNMQEIILHPRVIAAYQKVIDDTNPQFGQTEKIKKFSLVAGPWEPVKADGSQAELTPTLKLKRRVIVDKYDDLISGIYDV
jgi:long-chain acyl-CoA synthetase